MTPPLGQRVLYKLAQHDVDVIQGRRLYTASMGNLVRVGDTYPADVVRIFTADVANLQVLLDGPDTHWVTSRTQGEEPGQWTLPEEDLPLLVGELEHGTPVVCDRVHYVSYGTPGGEYASVCRAAIVTATPDPDGAVVDLCVLNPEGMFFNRGVALDKGGETVGDLECPNKGTHGNPFRYCACGWAEASYQGGTWHWPEHGSEQPAEHAGAGAK